MSAPSNTQFLIGPTREGVRKDLKPYAIPEAAWEELLNCYQFRGRITKRLGYNTLGRLQINLSNVSLPPSTTPTYAFNIFTDTIPPTAKGNAQIVIGSVTVTIGGVVYKDTGRGTLTTNSVVITGNITNIVSNNQSFRYTNFESINTLVRGSQITLSGIVGDVGTILNGNTYRVYFTPSPTEFLIKINTVGYNYISGGMWSTIVDLGQIGVINYQTGDVVITNIQPPGSLVTISFGYYPDLPVMGARTRGLFGINNQETIFFDTVHAYRYDSVTETIPALASTLPTIWSGTDSDFFYTTNYASAFWATNFKPGLHGSAITSTIAANPTVVTTTTPHGFTTGQTVVFINVSGSDINGKSGIITVLTPTTFSVPFLSVGVGSGGFALNSQINSGGQDGIRYYNGTTWTNYNPPINPNEALQGCLLMFGYKNYFVFLNTWEGPSTGGVVQKGNRARWTFVGTPYYSPPVPIGQGIDVQTARDDLFRGAGFVDAPTGEEIIGADFIRDVLVVYFTNSTWRLRFQQSALQPFVWERVNVEYGSNSTFSTIVFDKGLMAIGGRGIIISDSNNTIRIDQKIPDQIFEIDDANQGPDRVYGIRTFKTRLNYWTMPLSPTSNKFPNRVLVYNWEDQTWSLFNDSFTCYGYYLSSGSTNKTWLSLTDAWSSYTNTTWAPTINQENFENIVAGNQQGFILNLEQGMVNEPSFYISAISGSTFTSPGHNFEIGDWVKLTGIQGTTYADGNDLEGRNFKVLSVSGDTFILGEFESIFVGNIVSGTTFSYDLDDTYLPIYPGSVQINVGTGLASENFTDDNNDGILYGNYDASSGFINYTTGTFTINFAPILPIGSPVIVRVVGSQPIVEIETSGTYIGGGLISPIADISISSKLFNFFPKAEKTRISMIDFYMTQSKFGEVTCDLFADANSTIPINQPLIDNLRSNVVVTTQNPFEVSDSSQVIYRMYPQSQASTLQLEINLSDQQLSIDSINSSGIELDAMVIHARPSGRLY